MRTIHALSRKFGTPLKDVVPLKTIQNFVNNYSRICRENHDRMDKLSAWVHKRAYTGLEAMTESFTFGWQIDNAGKSVRGNGSDDKPIIVELSTKPLVLRLMVPPESFILHLDATYKMIQPFAPVSPRCSICDTPRDTSSISDGIVGPTTTVLLGYGKGTKS
ncbi:hypothetical protein F442_16807 [Phytophthora nicotianae P10297]|uniref:Uncharacterized protein n=1 Tax=Phytophthora nicotianae P10297 TaxID=1317064 RepID=W2YJE7_PHYNI|nr:hypothetical protein F442_16807 [Phytophthora nicotianae P10297]